MYLVFFAVFTLAWVACRWFATVVVCFSNEVSQFSFILIVLCPLASSRYGTLVGFCTVAEYLARWPIVELATTMALN